MLATSLAQRRRILSILFGSLFGLLYLLVWQWDVSPSEAQRPLSPMAGTYQYFSSHDFEYHTHKLDAISHCDPRYAPIVAPTIEDTRRTLLGLIKSYTAIMRDLRAETWLAHGTLLGWHWNQRFLPWDNDIDLQVSIETLTNYLVPRNLTEYSFSIPGDDSPRVYLLDVNPHYLIDDTRDVANTVDARWIDTSNGKFIDVTTVRGASSGLSNDKAVEEAVIFAKDGHTYNVSGEERLPVFHFPSWSSCRPR
jgi:hypothetical protein